jgi:hypothetical protein
MPFSVFRFPFESVVSNFHYQKVAEFGAYTWRSVERAYSR